jgi:hypothetical protein
MTPHGSYPAQQLALWKRLALPKRKKKGNTAPSRPAAALAPVTPLAEKTLPGVGGAVKVIGTPRRYTVAGVMLCGPQCYVWLRVEGVTSGDMALAKVEALTLA